MKVLKFGGSSVANSQNINQVIKIINTAMTPKARLVVVVSALGGVTDKLIDLAKSARREEITDYIQKLNQLIEQHIDTVTELIADANKSQKAIQGLEIIFEELRQQLQGINLIRELSKQSLDTVLSFGERLSSFIIANSLIASGFDCRHIDAREVIKTNSNFGEAVVDLSKTFAKIQETIGLESGLWLMGGFIASNDTGITTTLGRGGSDYTASLVGAGLNADSIEIWTDVEGVFSADPRIVKQAFAQETISYKEAGELAHFGAKVIHPKTMSPAEVRNIPILIKNTFKPELRGTLISSRSEHDYSIKAISTRKDIALVTFQAGEDLTVNQVAKRVFAIFEELGVDVLLTTQASHQKSITLGVNSSEIARAVATINTKLNLEIQANQILLSNIQKDLAIIAIVGEHMKGVPGISARFFRSLSKNNINIIAIAQGSSELNVSAVINLRDQKKALQTVHWEFFAPQRRAKHVFLIGPGLIGSTFLKQISKIDSNLSVAGIANSRKMVFSDQESLTNNWLNRLEQGQEMNLTKYIQTMVELDVPNKVFVDCSASSLVSQVYAEVLEQKIPVVTANKKANSAKYDQYQELLDICTKKEVKYLYETNVGAGLPVIEPLKNMIATGDQIQKIEAVLSGTLSYIFNTFSKEDISFSRIVSQAKDKGYTEPDPRDDLNGMDVARKLLILAREMGKRLELSDIIVTSFLPKYLFELETKEEFMQKLPEADNLLAELKNKAKNQNQVLRFIGCIDDRSARVELCSVGPDHPFYSLSGSDNIISIQSTRYNQTPMVIKGPGAGAEVTAAGVLGNVLSLS